MAEVLSPYLMSSRPFPAPELIKSWFMPTDHHLSRLRMPYQPEILSLNIQGSGKDPEDVVYLPGWDMALLTVAKCKHSQISQFLESQLGRWISLLYAQTSNQTFYSVLTCILVGFVI
jgi:hypothetical protein